MTIETEEALNEIVVWATQTLGAVDGLHTLNRNYVDGLRDGLRMVIGAIDSMKEEL